MNITQDTVLEGGVFHLPEGITIQADGVTLDGNGALLVGSGRRGSGLRLQDRSGVTIKNLHLQEYYHGIEARGCVDLTIRDCRVTATAEVEANTIFLDIWRTAEQAYGGGILLVDCRDSQVIGNDLQHQMAGLYAYGCRGLQVKDNNASYCSGWGFHLYETLDSLYENNCADYCCRWQPRGGRDGHMGADAAGFLIVHNASHNIFRRNLARMGGDGFFLAGLTPRYEAVPCNDNLFEENDASWSPNIAFEATFSAGNIYRRNYADHCNYGFWLGFSRAGLLEENRIAGNARAGIAVENGFDFTVRGNTIEDCDHGILLWSKHIPEFGAAVPLNDTSYNWTIQGNTFRHNNKALRLAANQDHGIRPYPVPAGQDPAQWRRPHDHILQGNTFTDNRIGVEALHADRTILTENHCQANLVADFIIQPD